LHNQLVARREALQDDLRAAGFQLAADCWVEQLKLKTALPSRPLAALSQTDALDVDRVVAEAATGPEFAAVLAELSEAIKAKLPKDLHDAFDRSDALQTLADDARALLAGERS
jgi:hypothetical protein